MGAPIVTALVVTVPVRLPSRTLTRMGDAETLEVGLDHACARIDGAGCATARTAQHCRRPSIRDGFDECEGSQGCLSLQVRLCYPSTVELYLVGDLVLHLPVNLR